MNSGKNRKLGESNSAFWDKFSKHLLHIESGFNPVSVSARIAVVYLIFGALWILLSDKILQAAVKDRDILMEISMLKGWIYVLITGILIGSLVYSAVKRLWSAEKQILLGYEELTAAHEQLEAAHEELMASEEELREQYNLLMENQKKLQDQEEWYRLISEGTNDGIWDEKNGERFFSDRWFEITGFSREELREIGDWRNLIHPEDKEGFLKSYNELVTNKNHYYNHEYRMKAKDGNYKWILAKAKVAYKEDGGIYRMAGSHTDITELKEYQEKLHHMAYYDSLTGLPNRLSLYEDLSKEFSTKGACSGALFFIDLDNFKYVNDTMGHAFGDQLLKNIGERFYNIFKDKGTAYRLGGDEFVLYIREYCNFEEIEYTALKIISDFKKPFYICGSVLHTTFSIGISMYPDHGNSAEELLKCADIAMYKAKGSGRNKFIFFDEKMNDEVKDRVIIEKHLRTALENGELLVYYQPQLELSTSKITGFEALLRWQSPELGFVSPLKFIKVAEESNLINSIGEWVLREACYFLKGLHQMGFKGLTISVNVSMLQLLQDNFTDMVMQVLNFLNLEAEYLELEVTESILMESYETIISKLTLLRKMGVKIALDDFGKGYSSLSYLKQLPITTLKIDKNFVDNIISKDSSRTLTGHIVTIGKSMGLKVIAEGVEEQEQLDYLINNECDRIQGYIFSKPLPEKGIIDLLSVDLTKTDKFPGKT